MTSEVTFDSKCHPGGTMIPLACGFISLTKITMCNENISITIEAKTGEICFFDAASQLLLSAKVKVPSSGDEKFSEVKCIAEGNQIKLGFPQYSYKDHYPNCDGEYDRWTKYISGFDFLCYDIQNNCINEEFAL